MISQEDRLGLLQSIRQMGGSGRAEGESPETLRTTFFPVSEHLRAIDPDAVLVVGPRGSGKSEIFRALTDVKLASAIAIHSPQLRVSPQELSRASWFKGYPFGTEGFDADGLRHFLATVGKEPDAVRQLWFAYLIRVLQSQLDPLALADLKFLLSRQGGAATENYEAWKAAGDRPLLALDRLDQKLESAGAYVFVAYDELDTLGGINWDAMSSGIQGLIAFWATYTRRWKRIRAKLFLRTDLYQRHVSVGGADLAKLAAARVELTWSDRNLYGMLLKRMANFDKRLREYLFSTKCKVHWDRDSTLGHQPSLNSWEDARPIIERMVGPYMGANVKKGHVYRWLLDHVRDGRNRAVPRPFVRLFEEAARIELDGFNPLPPPRLFHPASVRRALDSVSSEHVIGSKAEWPWLTGTIARLSGQQVPWERRREIERLLSIQGPNYQPPFQDSAEFLDFLFELGILRNRVDGRIDSPDLFLHGLGLKRKGGVRRD